jgi:hypothetical protein
LHHPEHDFSSVRYTGTGSLSAPGMGLFTQEPIDLQFVNQLDSMWLNISSFRDIPAGDFILAAPVRTLSGASLWNGQAGDAGTPLLSSLHNEPAFALWRLQQIPPGAPASIPLAGYEQGTASVTIESIPEPSAASLFGIGLTLLAAICRASSSRSYPGSGQ